MSNIDPGYKVCVECEGNGLENPSVGQNDCPLCGGSGKLFIGDFNEDFDEWGEDYDEEFSDQY